MWEITTGSVGISVEQLAIHMDANTVNVEVWHRPGVSDYSYYDSYEQKFSGSVTGQGQGVPTMLPAFATPIDIPPNSSHTFYTTGTTDPLSIYHSSGSAVHTVFASDSYIDIKEGWSGRFPFNTPTSPTQWNGKIERVYPQNVVAHFFISNDLIFYSLRFNLYFFLRRHCLLFHLRPT